MGSEPHADGKGGGGETGVDKRTNAARSALGRIEQATVWTPAECAYIRCCMYEHYIHTGRYLGNVLSMCLGAD